MIENDVDGCATCDLTPSLERTLQRRRSTTSAMSKSSQKHMTFIKAETWLRELSSGLYYVIIGGKKLILCLKVGLSDFNPFSSSSHSTSLLAAHTQSSTWLPSSVRSPQTLTLPSCAIVITSLKTKSRSTLMTPIAKLCRLELVLRV